MTKLSDRLEALADKLSERVERLEGPDRNLDAQIHHVITNGIGCGMAQHAPTYTASLDAAMSLVPEGWRISNFSQHDHAMLRERGEWMCSLYPDGRLDECNRDFDWPRCEHAATPANALLAAILKARGL